MNVRSSHTLSVGLLRATVGGGGRTDPTSAQAARVRGVIARMLDLGFPEGRVWLGFREKGGGV